MTLGYVAWPEAIDYDDPVLYVFADWGYTFLESLRLAYYYGNADDVAGVDALTGKPVAAETYDTTGAYTYDDLDGVPCRAAAEALGAAGVGFAGGRFEPDSVVTMRDAAALLLASAGMDVTDWDDGTIGNEAAWYGFIDTDDWAPDDAITRTAFTRMILSASRYAAAAGLTGIWSDAFTGPDAGYAAIASALGMTASGEPDATCTRADAVTILYAFMSR